jgi:hypothetical protein
VLAVCCGRWEYDRAVYSGRAVGGESAVSSDSDSSDRLREIDSKSSSPKLSSTDACSDGDAGGSGPAAQCCDKSSESDSGTSSAGGVNRFGVDLD